MSRRSPSPSKTPRFGEAVILVGHGVPASDAPRALVTELKALEARRRAGGLSIRSREIELDRVLRNWPRTPKTDPYKAGLERLATRLRARLGRTRLEVAYNEFCTPGLKEAIEILAAEGYGRIVLVPTMFTPGGLHSEIEIPEIVKTERARFPDLELVYAWPFDPDLIATFLNDHLNQSRKRHRTSRPG